VVEPRLGVAGRGEERRDRGVAGGVLVADRGVVGAEGEEEPLVRLQERVPEVRRSFQTRAAQPGGRRMRANSVRAAAWSNQWNAWPATTRSTLPVGNVVASARPSVLRNPGRRPSS
jgi:hypothetical protein